VWKGQTTILMVVMALALLTFAGLLYDAGNLFAARRELQNAADSAARAGADALDVRNYRRQEGQGSDAYGFGRGIAEATARQYLAAQGITDGEVDAGGRAVIVRVRRTVPTILLRGFDGAGFTVVVSAGAEPVVR
jgi:Flp pilus assembly protein TadG